MASRSRPLGLSSRSPSSPGQRFKPAPGRVMLTAPGPGQPALLPLGCPGEWVGLVVLVCLCRWIEESNKEIIHFFSKHERLLPLLTLSRRLSEETRSFYSCLIVLCFPGTLHHPCLQFAWVRAFHFVLLFRRFHYEKYRKYIERIE